MPILYYIHLSVACTSLSSEVLYRAFLTKQTEAPPNRGESEKRAENFQTDIALSSRSGVISFKIEGECFTQQPREKFPMIAPGLIKCQTRVESACKMGNLNYVCIQGVFEITNWVLFVRYDRC